jgi:hypothetical protein
VNLTEVVIILHVAAVLVGITKSNTGYIIRWANLIYTNNSNHVSMQQAAPAHTVTALHVTKPHFNFFEGIVQEKSSLGPDTRGRAYEVNK